MQALTRFTTPFIVMVARWTFTPQMRLVCRLEWLTLWPCPATLPQIWHFPGISLPPLMRT